MITGELLTQIPLFAGLPQSERESLASRAADVRLRAGEWLLIEGQAPAFFALLEGELAVFKSVTGRRHAHPYSQAGRVFRRGASAARRAVDRQRSGDIALARRAVRRRRLSRSDQPLPSAQRPDHEDDGRAGRVPTADRGGRRLP